MSDNPKKKKADGKRVALRQNHERRCLLECLGKAAEGHVGCQMALKAAQNQLYKAEQELMNSGAMLENMAARLEAGTRRGGRKEGRKQ